MNQEAIVILAVAAVVGYSLIRIAGILLPRYIARGIAGVMEATIDGALAELKMHEQQSNHARFEGTWTPHEMGLLAARRELDRYQRGVRRQAHLHGETLQEPLEMGNPENDPGADRMTV